MGWNRAMASALMVAFAKYTERRKQKKEKKGAREEASAII
jgi:hypothetical protein